MLPRYFFEQAQPLGIFRGFPWANFVFGLIVIGKVCCL